MASAMDRQALLDKKKKLRESINSNRDRRSTASGNPGFGNTASGWRVGKPGPDNKAAQQMKEREANRSEESKAKMEADRLRNNEKKNGGSTTTSQSTRKAGDTFTSERGGNPTAAQAKPQSSFGVDLSELEYSQVNNYGNTGNPTRFAGDAVSSPSRFDDRVAQLMRKRGWSKEKAEENQRGAIAAGGDINGDGMVTDAEWAEFKKGKTQSTQPVNSSLMFDKRVAQLMKNRGWSKEKAEENQRGAIAAGGDLNGDGMVTDSEWAKFKNGGSSSTPKPPKDLNTGDWDKYLNENKDVQDWWDDASQEGIMGGNGVYRQNRGRDTTGWEDNWLMGMNNAYGTNNTDVGQFSKEQFAQYHYDTWGQKEGRDRMAGDIMNTNIDTDINTNVLTDINTDTDINSNITTDVNNNTNVNSNSTTDVNNNVDNNTSVTTDNSDTDNSTDNSINDSYNQDTDDSYNTDESINDSYNETTDESNSGIQSNELDQGSVAVIDGQGMGGNNEFDNEYDQSFNGTFDVSGNNTNYGVQNSDLSINFNYAEMMNQYGSGAGGYNPALAMMDAYNNAWQTIAQNNNRAARGAGQFNNIFQNGINMSGLNKST